MINTGNLMTTEAKHNKKRKQIKKMFQIKFSIKDGKIIEKLKIILHQLRHK